MNKVIFTIFAGRKDNLQILFAYLEKLYSKNSIDEIHIWDFTKDVNDERYISDYVGGKIPNDGDILDFKNDMIIGDYKINLIDSNLKITNITNGSIIQDVCISNNSLTIKIKKTKIETSFTIINDDNTCIISTIIGSDNLRVKYPGWKVFKVLNKKLWGEYYSYYANQTLYTGNDVIIKCDDDVVFIDCEYFDSFIERRIKNKNYLLYFPNIVNNGVTAFHQSQHKLIPMNMPYDTFFGKLVLDGALANNLHSHFCDDVYGYLKKSRNIKTIIAHKIGDRISINFFAILAKHLDIYKSVGWDDEHDVSVTIPKMYGAGIGIDMSLTVCHLGFSPQRKTGLDERLFVKRYLQVLKDYKDYNTRKSSSIILL